MFNLIGKLNSPSSRSASLRSIVFNNSLPTFWTIPPMIPSTIPSVASIPTGSTYGPSSGNCWGLFRGLISLAFAAHRASMESGAGFSPFLGADVVSPFFLARPLAEASFLVEGDFLRFRCLGASWYSASESTSISDSESAAKDSSSSSASRPGSNSSLSLSSSIRFFSALMPALLFFVPTPLFFFSRFLGNPSSILSSSSSKSLSSV